MVGEYVCRRVGLREAVLGGGVAGWWGCGVWSWVGGCEVGGGLGGGCGGGGGGWAGGGGGGGELVVV